MTAVVGISQSEEPVGYIPPSDSVRGSVRVGLIIILVFFGGLGGWAAVAPLNAAVVGDGVVKVEGNRKSVQQLDGGMVSDLRVREGDHVNEGDVLMVIDDTQARADLAILTKQQQILRATEARLIAERDGRPSIEFPVDLLAQTSDADMKTALDSQQNEFASRRTSLDGQVAVLQQRLSQAQDQINANQQLLVTQQTQLQSVAEERASLDGLYSKGLVTRPRILQLDRTATGLQGQIAQTTGNISAGQKSVDEIEKQIDQLANDRMTDVTKTLSDVQSKLQDLTPRIENGRATLGRTEIRAPYAGQVVDLAVFSMGAVIGRGERLLDIVPDNAPLVVEAKVRVEDIADIAPGMSSEIHFTSYKQRITPIIHGRVTEVSADRLTDPRTEVPYYVAQVQVDSAELANSPEIQLYPGMPATVMITTKARTALDYLLGPLVAGFDRSFRER